MLSFFRIIKFALQDIVRNVSLSFMTILILVLMLLSVNTLFVVRVLTQEATAAIKEQIDVSIYFDHSVDEEKVDEVRAYVQSFPEVTDMTFYTREEVLAQFRDEHQSNPEIIASLDELDNNPLGPTLVIKTREPSDYQKIITALNVPEYEHIIEAKTFDDTERAIERIHIITSQVERFSVALSAFFGIVAFLIIFNTIRVIIYTQRIEINIKKLVGASNWFVRGPYFIESFIFSVVAAGVTAGVVFLAADVLDPFIGVVFGHPQFLTDYFSSNILWLFGSQFGVVLVLTLFSSMLAMRRYLRA